VNAKVFYLLLYSIALRTISISPTPKLSYNKECDGSIRKTFSKTKDSDDEYKNNVNLLLLHYT